MSEIPQWAKDKAREWLRGKIASTSGTQTFEQHAMSLAALLVEVNDKAGLDVYAEARAEARKQTLAEARRVVTVAVDDLAQRAGHSPAEMLEWNGKVAGAIWVRDEILSRRDAL